MLLTLLMLLMLLLFAWILVFEFMSSFEASSIVVNCLIEFETESFLYKLSVYNSFIKLLSSLLF